MNEERQIIIGEREGWREPQRFGISQVDQRQHIYVIGKTGSGKTTLLRNLILQHIGLGHGVGLIDPHGDLAEEILHHIPRHRADHLVYFNPGDLEFPIGLNLLANIEPDDRHLVASGIVSALMGSFLSPAQEELIIRHTTAQSTVLLMFDEDAAGKLCREQVMLRLCTRRFIKVFPFPREGQQPEHLTAEEIKEVVR